MARPLTGDPKAHDPSEFANGMTGTCLCGSISVTIHDSELFERRRGSLCHCANCRKVAGSFVATNFVIETEKVKIQDAKGTLKTYMDYATQSGKPVARSFCSVDGNPIKSETEFLPGKFILKMGIFPRIPTPESEGFALHRQSWEPSVEGTEKFKIGGGGEKIEEETGP